MKSQFLSPINLRNDVRRILQEAFSKFLTKEMIVYDIGCGDKPFGPFLKDKVKEHIGVDIEDGFYDKGHIDLIGTAYDIPVEDNVADAVISSQVIEHLDKPLDAIKEAARVLKDDGLLFLAFPFMYPIHAAPHDYGRYTEFYIKKVLQDYGFEVVSQKHIGGFWYCIGMFSGLYLQNFDRGILRKTRLTKLLIWIAKALMRVLHEIEGFVLSLIKKDKKKFRQIWTVNYVLVCKKAVTK